MGNTYSKIYLQFVFAVQDRASLIKTDWQVELYKYITGIVQNNRHKLIAVNGMPDHLHLFIGYSPHQLISNLLKDVKGYSSKWINKKRFVRGKFTWQEGYGVFSYSKSHINAVVKYIEDQEQHHRRKTFREEYIQLLNQFTVNYDKRYLLKDVL